MVDRGQLVVPGCEVEVGVDQSLCRTVLLDLPWPEIGAGKVKRGCDRWYKTIHSWPEMVRVVHTSGVWDRVAPDAHLYLWSTSNYEAWAHRIIEALGFKHHVSLPWVKPGNAGLGQYWRGTHEPLMFATRGRGFDVKTDTRSLRSDCLVGAQRPVDEHGKRIHSAKPARAFEIIEERSLGPFLELFARGKPFNSNWTVWGHEADG